MALTTKNQTQEKKLNSFAIDKSFNTIEKLKQNPGDQMFSAGLSFGPKTIKKQQ